MAQLATANYSIRNYQPDDEPGVIDLMRAALGETKDLPRSSRLWRWKHFDNPFGASLVKVAVTPAGRVIGLRAFMRWQFLKDGEPVNAARPVDTATHPDFQRQGIFARLTNDALAEAAQDGTNVIYNTPNAKSGPGYLKLGWSEVGNVRPFIKVLNIPRMVWGVGIKRLRKGQPTSYSEDAFFKVVPPSISSLLDMTGLPALISQDEALWGALLHTPRSTAFLDWRYANHPTMSYYAITLEEQGELVGCLVFRPKTRFALKEIGVTELLIARQDERVVKELFRRLKAAVQADYIVSYVPQGTFHARALRRAGFRKIPGRGLTLVANTIGRPLGDLQDLDRWALTLGDIEFF